MPPLSHDRRPAPAFLARRDFLRRIGIASGGLGVAGFAPFAADAAADAAAKEPNP